MRSNCHNTYYLSGIKCASHEVVAHYHGPDGNFINARVVVSGPTNPGEISLAELSQIHAVTPVDMFLPGISTPLAFDPARTSSKRGRLFDPNALEVTLGPDYPFALDYAVKHIPRFAKESRYYARSVASAWLDTRPATGLAHAARRVPGLFNLDPTHFMNRYESNPGVLCALLPQLVSTLTPTPDRENLSTLVTYINFLEKNAKVPELLSPIKASALDRLGIATTPDLTKPTRLFQTSPDPTRLALSALESTLEIDHLARALFLGPRDRLIYTARRTDEYISAQANLEQIGSRVTDELRNRCGLVAWAVSLTPAQDYGYAPDSDPARFALPKYSSRGVPLGEYRICGLDSSARVFTYYTANSESALEFIGSRTMSAADEINDTWHPSEKDALRGTARVAPGADELTSLMAEVVLAHRDTEYAEELSEMFDDTLLNADEYLRPIRGWLLAQVQTPLAVDLLG